jgi:hypothetical protein
MLLTFAQSFDAATEFVLDDDARGRIWLAEHDGRLAGTEPA